MIARLDRPARDQRNPHRFEVARRDQHLAGVPALFARLRLRPALDDEIVEPAGTALDRQARDRARRFHARQRGDSLDERRVEVAHGRRVRIGRQRQRLPDRVHTLGVEAEIDSANVLVAAQQQTRADDEHHAQRDLRDDERAHQPRPAADDAARLRAQHGLGRRRARAQRRQEPEQQRGEPCHRCRERERAPVERDRLRARQRAGIEAQEAVEERDRGSDAERTAGEREQHALGEQMRDEPPASRAEREAHGELAPAAFTAREQQAREVRADDEQHEPHGAEQHRELGPNVADDLVEVGAQEHRVASVVVVGLLASSPSTCAPRLPPRRTWRRARAARPPTSCGSGAGPTARFAGSTFALRHNRAVASGNTKPAGMTPTISHGVPSKRAVRPSAPRSPPNASSHKPWLSTTTHAAPG